MEMYKHEEEATQPKLGEDTIEGQDQDQCKDTDQMWKHIFSFVESHALNCAVELHIADIIHKHGSPTPISHLASKTPVPCSPDRLGRLMQFLDHLGLFKLHSSKTHNYGGEEDAYSLTPLSELLVRAAENNLSPLASIDSVFYMEPWHHLKDSLEQEDGITTFRRLFGVEFYELAERNEEFGKRINEQMNTDTRITVQAILVQLKQVFDGVESLVDVGGGIGAATRAIAEAFPSIKCTLFDLPHVVAAAPENPRINRIAGDMFDSIPTADALLLKWILHNYGDEDCISILKKCKEALPSKGGKLIIVEAVIKDDEEDEFTWGKLSLDLEMMLLFGAKERTEEEWTSLLQRVGFSKYNILPIKSTVYSLIEVYL